MIRLNRIIIDVCAGNPCPVDAAFAFICSHGDDLILKRMKRRHLARDVLRFCEEARRRRPDVVFGADLIAGFPTETEQAHQNTLKLITTAGLTHLHVFGYSPREGTPAANMPQLDRSVIKQRVAEVKAAGDKQLAAHGPRVGTSDMLPLKLVRKAIYLVMKKPVYLRPGRQANRSINLVSERADRPSRMALYMSHHCS